MKTIRVQEQVLALDSDFSKDEHGQTRVCYSVCPYCEARNFIVSRNRSQLYADQYTACAHNRGAVDAGFPRVAIHFESEMERAS